MIRLAAVIPAAGLSSRMGSFKPLLPLGDRTVVEQVVRLFTAEGVDPVIAVTGKRSDEVADAARRAGGDVVHNPGFEQGMFSSVLAGVESLPELVEAFFLLPADMPLIRQETVQLLVEELRPLHGKSHTFTL
ncbi:Metal dependent phosphohydrolase (fragment) [Pseudodesulfovibrio profundus]|uniref:Metal dependent phosphohydrolase n=1 Tax=Pseudodesulfovibrio profundus TaxID=57320 RepID=A0A2C8F841_9BACT